MGHAAQLALMVPEPEEKAVTVMASIGGARATHCGYLCGLRWLGNGLAAVVVHSRNRGVEQRAPDGALTKLVSLRAPVGRGDHDGEDGGA